MLFSSESTEDVGGAETGPFGSSVNAAKKHI